MNEYVRTAVRWRTPTENREIAVEKLSENAISIKEYQFEFGMVIDGGTQHEIYDVLTKPMVDKALEGFDSTFFAYGQSGTGKTYSMGFNVSENSDSNGIAVRIANDIFSRPNIAEMNVFISFIEIYNNKVYDFLSEKSTKTLPTKNFLRIYYVYGDRKNFELCKLIFYYDRVHITYYTDKKYFKRLLVAGLKNLNAVKKLVNNESEIISLLSTASKSRRVRSTNLNVKSSRSHAILSICIAHMQQEEIITESSINLVDLAGIEGVRNTDHTGDALTEGGFINKDLSYISRVIKDISQKRPVISYRNSSLTMLLQDSLNTRSYLTLLVCISPYVDDVSKTLATMEFAKVAKTIKLLPQSNIENQRSKTPSRTSIKNTVLSQRLQRRNTPFKSLNRKPISGFSGIPVSSNRPSLIHPDANIPTSPSNCEFNNNMKPNVNTIDSTPTNGCKSSSIEARLILLPNERPRITPTVSRIREDLCKNWSRADLRLLASRLMDTPSSSSERTDAVETLLTLPFSPITESPRSADREHFLIKSQASVLLPQTNQNEYSNEENMLVTSSTELPLQLVENRSSSPLSIAKKKRRIHEKETENKSDSVIDNKNIVDSTNVIEDTPRLLRKRKSPDHVSEYFAPETIRRSKRQKPDRSQTCLGAEVSTTQSIGTSRVQRNTNRRNLTSKPVLIDNTLHTTRRSTHKKTRSKNVPKVICSPGSINSNPLEKSPLLKSSTPFKSVENTTLRRSERKSRRAESVTENADTCASAAAVGSRSILSNARAPKILLKRANNIKGSYTSTLVQPGDKKRRKRLTLFEGPEKDVKPTRYSSDDTENYILNVLNDGSLKDIQELATFGKKTANLIFNYRNSNGIFKSVKALEELKFVNYKLFLAKNNLLK